jgi:hypothetical protein
VTYRIQYFLPFIALISTTHMSNAITGSKIIPRSQSVNAARQLVGWDNPFWGINRLPQDKCYASGNLTFAYTRTFKDSKISYFFFGDDLQCVCAPVDPKIGREEIIISGSAVPNRAPTNWLADYFGLPRDFQSSVTMNPRIENFVLDFSFYVGLDGWLNGLYFRINGPYTYTKWGFNATEIITSNTGYALPGDKGYFQGYFSSNEVPAANLNRGFLEYASGSTPTINNDYGAYGESYCETYGPCTALGSITWNPLCCSKLLDCGTLSRNGFADLRFVLGYNFLNNRDGNYHLGAGIYAAAPTGSRVGEGNKGNYLMDPIIGNGKHWELGAQITAHHIWWRSADDENSFGIYFEANITHLFSACQTRCFDLLSAGDSSRYIIAQRLASNSSIYPALSTTADPQALAFANEYAPVANITRSTVTSNIAAQGDIAFALAYQVHDFRWDLGYNFWGRSCENLCVQKNSNAANTGTWAIKGDERVYGFMNNSPAQSLAIPLAVSDSQATIHAGSNQLHYVDYTPVEPTEPKNFYADNIVFAGANITTLPENGIKIYTSQNPILVKQSDFNTSGTRGYSHKLFTHFNWAWTEHEGRTWVPYLGMGAEVEFGSAASKCCKVDCSGPQLCNNSGACSGLVNTCSECCINFALTQWGIWFKIGSSYN